MKATLFLVLACFVVGCGIVPQGAREIFTPRLGTTLTITNGTDEVLGVRENGKEFHIAPQGWFIDSVAYPRLEPLNFQKPYTFFVVAKTDILGTVANWNIYHQPREWGGTWSNAPYHSNDAAWIVEKSGKRLLVRKTK